MAYLGTKSTLVVTALAGVAVGATLTRTSTIRQGAEMLGLYAYMTAMNRGPVDIRIPREALKRQDDPPAPLFYSPSLPEPALSRPRPEADAVPAGSPGGA
jgi:hypothetical protein